MRSRTRPLEQAVFFSGFVAFFNENVAVSLSFRAFENVNEQVLMLACFADDLPFLAVPRFPHYITHHSFFTTI
jgi:hypothetical protein